MSCSWYFSWVGAATIACHALKKASQASIVVKAGLQCCWIFLLACQAQSKAEESGKTIVIAFHSARSQSVDITPGLVIIVGVLSLENSSLIQFNAQVYDSSFGLEERQSRYRSSWSYYQFLSLLV